MCTWWSRSSDCKKVKLDLDQPIAATNVAKVEECGRVSDHVKNFCGRVWRISRYYEHELNGFKKFGGSLVERSVRFYSRLPYYTWQVGFVAGSKDRFSFNFQLRHGVACSLGHLDRSKPADPCQEGWLTWSIFQIGIRILYPWIDRVQMSCCDESSTLAD